MKQAVSNISRAVFFKHSRFAFSSFSKYPFLAELGLSPENHGAFYDGEWRTTDSTHTFKTINPATEELVATTKTASLKDYEKAISAMQVANI